MRGEAMMIGYPEAPRAWWLTRGMARVSGVNLSQAVVEGWLRRSELADIIARCAACAKGETCDQWLAKSGGEHSMPGFCPNKPEIESLGG
jgi:Family of unknown function (DUF6455)